MSVRIALAITFIIGCLYASFGVFESLWKFGIGMIVSSTAVLVWGFLDYNDGSHDDRIAEERDQVWARRDQS
jgi:hypothetical protein